ncbi:MAG TPA: C4-dicarboxylate ABC transporter permease [Deltaproteobacteria bacterium]|nr:MAG: C4-dicarboxylate ABC transporter permease [Deltaproteobacteria bacterium GWA2_65_63]OGP29247.1 MAG: C4-dicarboxylate ABC transporter permease [Deltaproteobacteria bacterium GWB2_65_81]OGP36956.1 MAG: C4-dicarboxylate ABC transporter permease [Deltaproteobacteria bacterium GWC2_66_88]OGP77855.1 MAG: C4-dicarboxylate ABC transporter permease [Deltaproteobacteria bacterium RBG_16_66_15]HAM33084.1 C4-dicarboxylate ABC transporter permease [Deltaproteobacteria bacterium]
MSGPVLGVAGIVVMFFILFVLRVPAAFTMALVGFLGIACVTSPEAAFAMIGSEMWTLFSNYGLTVIPLFILVGEIVHYAGYNHGLYHATYRWFGHYRGGLAMTTIMACAAFSAISGSNTATAATMSAVAIPEMKKYGYHPVLNSGAVAAGATLGVLIPPSIVLVVYGLYTGQSIGKLFFGNVIPSAILTVLILGTVVLICRRHPDWGPSGPRSSWKDRYRALPEALDILVLFAVIMYALFTGVVTATEAAAVSCFLALVICLVRRKLTWPKFLDAMTDTLRISCLVFMIVAGAVIFSRFLTVTRLPFAAAEWIQTLALPKWMVLWVILLCYIVGGCVMDALAFLLVSLPIFYPLVVQLGYDPIWFGQVITIVTTMGSIMPPIGICCYVVAGMSDIPLGTVFRGGLYYIPSYIVSIVILMISPYWTVLVLSELVK